MQITIKVEPDELAKLCNNGGGVIEANIAEVSVADGSSVTPFSVQAGWLGSGRLMLTLRPKTSNVIHA